MQLFDVITVGDVIVDLFVHLPKTGTHFTVDEKTISLMLGEKIPVQDTDFSLGGNATHVAIGLSRLGHKVALVAEIGDDEFSGKILKDLDTERIAKNLLKQTPNTPSTFTVSISAQGDRTTLVHHVERAHDFSFANVSAGWVYLTSMGDKWESAYQNTLDFVKENSIPLAFNPGSTQLKKGIDSFAFVVAACDLLIVNKEEAEEILYKEVLPQEKKESPEALLFRLQRMGPKMVVLTDGSNGSYAIDQEGKVYQQEAFKIPITENTGAGDGFATGVLGALLEKKNLQEALLWGTANAAGVISKIGGQEGLLTKPELDHMMQEHL